MYYEEILNFRRLATCMQLGSGQIVQPMKLYAATSVTLLHDAAAAAAAAAQMSVRMPGIC